MKQRRWMAVEVVGVALIAVALAFIHLAVGVGVVGVYLFATAITRQLVEADVRPAKQQQDGGQRNG